MGIKSGVYNEATCSRRERKGAPGVLRSGGARGLQLEPRPDRPPALTPARFTSSNQVLLNKVSLVAGAKSDDLLTEVAVVYECHKQSLTTSADAKRKTRH